MGGVYVQNIVIKLFVITAGHLGAQSSFASSDYKEYSESLHPNAMLIPDKGVRTLCFWKFCHNLETITIKGI